MEIDATKPNITVNKLINSKKEIVIVEGDMIVPDVKPDILNTIDTTGNVCIYKKEVQDGRVKFDGGINLNIIYLADSSNDFTRGLNHTLDFTKNINVENCKSGMDLKSSVEIKDIECRVLNGRKISIKVTLEIRVTIYSNEEINILKQINNIDNIQTLNSNIKINNLIGNGTCRVMAKDNISLEGEDNLGEILKTEISVTNSEMKVSYNKVLLKADTNVKIMYLTEDNQIKIVFSTIPLMGFIDINNVWEQSILNSSYEIRNILVKPNSAEQHSVYVEIEFEICCDAVDNMDIELIQDMYCPTQNLQFRQKEINTMTNKEIIKDICNIREKISIPEILNNKIYDVEIIPNINNINVLSERLVYECELNMNFIFSSDNNLQINTKRYTLPFTFNIDNKQINSNKIIETKMNCINNNYSLTSDGLIDSKIDIEFEVEMYNNTNIKIIDEINIVEEEQEPNSSMVIYIVKEGDTLWNIAKKYSTTIEEIVKINKIDDPDKLEINQKLFIPRYCANKIA